MTTKYSPGGRLTASLADNISLVGGQLIYLGVELLWRLLRRSAPARETRAARRAMRLYWKARALERQGRLTEAFTISRASYAVLSEADRDATFTETIMTVAQLDRFACMIGQPDAVRPELADALAVLRPIHADPASQSEELDRVMTWIDSRLRATEGH